MKWLKFICFSILLLPYSGYTQHILSANLVNNPGFENYTDCPNSWSQICKSTYWDDTYNCNRSTDYLNICTLEPNILDYIQNNPPLSGLGYAGFIPYILPQSWSNWREYLQNKLKEKLKKEKNYCCEYNVVLGKNKNFAIENLDVFFSVNQVSSFNPNNPGKMILDSVPQIKNRKGIIFDTINWTKINGVFKSKGNENYIIIGNFTNDIYTNVLQLNKNSQFAYYFIDDVSVCECSFDINLGVDTVLCVSETIILNPNLPNATYTWQDSSHASTYEVKQPGTYWVRAFVAEYDITSTDTIVITAATDNYCNPPLTIPNVITPNGDSQNDKFQIQNAESYNIALQIYNRWGTLIYETTSYQNDFSCRDCADGVYFYVLKAKSKRNGREKEYKGSLTVING